MDSNRRHMGSLRIDIRDVGRIKVIFGGIYNEDCHFILFADRSEGKVDGMKDVMKGGSR